MEFVSQLRRISQHHGLAEQADTDGLFFGIHGLENVFARHWAACEE
jgi:hypothetical protein